MQKKTVKYYILRFSAEFVLIMASIILSFYIQGKIEKQEARKEAKHILTQIMADLISDTTKYNEELQDGQRLIEVCNYLLNLDYEKKLQTNKDFDTTIYLIGQTTNNLYTPIHIVGYTRLINFDNKEVINNNVMIDSIIGDYTINKAKMDGFFEMDRHYVDVTMIDYYLKDYSYQILESYYSRNLLNEDLHINIREEIIQFLEKQEIRSLLIFNILNKNNYMVAINSNRRAAISRINMIKSWLVK